MKFYNPWSYQNKLLRCLIEQTKEGTLKWEHTERDIYTCIHAEFVLRLSYSHDCYFNSYASLRTSRGEKDIDWFIGQLVDELRHIVLSLEKWNDVDGEAKAREELLKEVCNG